MENRGVVYSKIVGNQNKLPDMKTSYFLFFTHCPIHTTLSYHTDMTATIPITATNQVTNTAQIIYQAKSVTLLPGFRVLPIATGTFEVLVGGCN